MAYTVKKGKLVAVSSNNRPPPGMVNTAGRAGPDFVDPARMGPKQISKETTDRATRSFAVQAAVSSGMGQTLNGDGQAVTDVDKLLASALKIEEFVKTGRFTRSAIPVAHEPDENGPTTLPEKSTW